MSSVYKHWRDHGGNLDEDYEYEASSDSCKEDRYEKYIKPRDFKEYHRIREDVYEMKKRLM